MPESEASLDPLVVRANKDAARAVRAWLIASGLDAEIDDLRFQDEGRVVPAPNLSDLLESLNDAAREACEGADRLALLNTDPDPDSVRVQAETEASSTAGSADNAERLARRLAQVGFGVSAQTMGGERIERLDRACTAIIAPPEQGLVRSMPLADDLPAITARGREELEVELAGVICRLLVERSRPVALSAGSVRVVLRVDSVDHLHVTVAAADQSADPEPGWLAEGKTLTASWDSPVVVSEPARQIAGHLLADGLVTPVLTIELAPA